MLQTNYIQFIFISLCLFLSSISFAQEKKELPEHEREAIQQVFTGNEEMLAGNVLEGEKSYRRAVSKDPNNLEAKYNLGYSYYKTSNFQEAMQRNKEAVKNAKTKAEKHISNHNLGNSYLQMGKPDEAIEAYKNALRNNPTDDETRYNLAVARQAKQQQDQNKDQNKENKDEKGDNEDKKDGEKGDDKKDGEDGDEEKDKDKEEGDDKEDKGGEDEKENEDKPEDKKDGDKGDGDEDKDQKPPQPREGKLSPDQVKSLLEAMADEEKKVQDKMNEKKARGVRVKTDKDW